MPTLRSALLLGCLLGVAESFLGGGALAPRCGLSSRSAAAAPTMKIFDWKTRGDAAPELTTIDLGNLKASPGSNQAGKRKGRGISAGQGASCGFGYRGQKSRSGSPTRPGFEGGQIPLYRRIPKFVGRPMGMSHSKTEYQIIKLSALNSMAEGAEVDFETLKAARAVRKSKYKLNKVVGSEGGLTVKGLVVKAHAFTETAKSAIEEQGGKCVVLSPTTNLPLEA